jgi:hypothetical protein
MGIVSNALIPLARCARWEVEEYLLKFYYKVLYKQ